MRSRCTTGRGWINGDGAEEKRNGTNCTKALCSGEPRYAVGEGSVDQADVQGIAWTRYSGPRGDSSSNIWLRRQAWTSYDSHDAMPGSDVGKCASCDMKQTGSRSVEPKGGNNTCGTSTTVQLSKGGTESEADGMTNCVRRTNAGPDTKYRPLSRRETKAGLDKGTQLDTSVTNYCLLSVLPSCSISWMPFVRQVVVSPGDGMEERECGRPILNNGAVQYDNESKGGERADAMWDWKCACPEVLEILRDGYGTGADSPAVTWMQPQGGYGTGADLPAVPAEPCCSWRVRCRVAWKKICPKQRARYSECECEEMLWFTFERQQPRCQQKVGGSRTIGCAAESRPAKKCCSVGVVGRRSCSVRALTHRAISYGWRAPGSGPWLKQQCSDTMEKRRIRHDSDDEQERKRQRIRRLSEQHQVAEKEGGDHAEVREEHSMHKLMWRCCWQVENGVFDDPARRSQCRAGQRRRRMWRRLTRAVEAGAGGESTRAELTSKTSMVSHLAVGCSIEAWLWATGIEPHPGPRIWQADVRCEEDQIDLSNYHQVGGASSSGSNSSSGGGSATTKQEGELNQSDCGTHTAC